MPKTIGVGRRSSDSASFFIQTSRRARRADLAIFAIEENAKSKWSGGRDSNPRPSGPKPDALPDCATARLMQTPPGVWHYRKKTNHLWALVKLFRLRKMRVLDCGLLPAAELRVKRRAFFSGKNICLSDRRRSIFSQGLHFFASANPPFRLGARAWRKRQMEAGGRAKKNAGEMPAFAKLKKTTLSRQTRLALFPPLRRRQAQTWRLGAGNPDRPIWILSSIFCSCPR